MHKLISKKEAQVTRFLTLENMKTGTVDYCFDDSDLFNDGYYSMEEGKIYECMILLFGDLNRGKKDIKILCNVVRDNVIVGARKSRLVEVKVGEDVYYVPYSEVKDVLDKASFYFYCARKDLIMVDGVLSGRYARKRRSEA